VVVCPQDASNEADMRSILCSMAVKEIAPTVRVVVEVNNPNHADHFRRAGADEILVTSRIASRLLARSSLYPGLAELVTDIVSGGEGSELYRVQLPDAYVGMSVDELSAQLRAEHQATLLAVGRDGRAHVNPVTDFRLMSGDDAIVVAESLGSLAPLVIDRDG
jgi:voltage-gated potassium channel